MNNLEISYEREYGKNFVKIGSVGKANEYALRMLEENEINGLLPVMKGFVDSEENYIYDVGGMTSLEKHFAQRQMEYEDLKLIISGISELYDRLEEYLLDFKKLYINPFAIFISAAGDTLGFCYYPEEIENNGDGLRKLGAFILKKINHEDERCFTAGYGFFDAVSRDAFDIEEVRDLIKENTSQSSPETDKPPETANERPIELSYDESDFEDFFEKEESSELPPPPESRSAKERLIKYATLLVPAAAFIAIALFMFSDKMDGLSPGLRAACLILLGAALCLAGMVIRKR